MLEGALCGSAEDLLKALSIIEDRGGPSNRGKSLLFVPKENDLSCTLFSSKIPVARENFDLLGCSIGSPTYCAASVLQRGGIKVKEILLLLPDLEDSQKEALRHVSLFQRFPLLFELTLPATCTSEEPLQKLISPCLSHS